MLIGLIGAGAMGSAIGARFVQHGYRVLSPVSGRSEGTRRRAEAAGLEDCRLEDLATAAMILSIVPPGQAESVIGQLGRALDGKEWPLVVEANALSPDTKARMAERARGFGGGLVDAAIIGAPPRQDDAGPRFYVCGDRSGEVLVLREGGLDVRLVDGPIGTVAALKMCYGGLNKGVTALTTAALLQAERVGVAGPLLDELAISQQFLLGRAQRSVPQMYSKAYRWVHEFEEIATFTQDAPAESAIFTAISIFYAQRAAACEEGGEPAMIDALLSKSGPGSRAKPS